jgi:hypothetical protein
MSTIAPDDPAPVHVNLAGLTDFATQLRADVLDPLRQKVPELIDAYGVGVTIADGLPTPAMTQVRRHYQECLASMVDQLNHFVLAGSILADAATLMADRYRDADALSHSSLTDVQEAIKAATEKSPEPTTDPDRLLRRYGSRTAE